VDTVLLTGEAFPPKDSVSDVEVLEQEPTRPHIQFAELSVSCLWLSAERGRQKILEKAATLGADAVVFSEPGIQPLAQSESPVGYTGPPNGSGPRGDGGFRPGDVKIVLIRDGGGGHGRGSYGGAMRGRSVPSSARPWARHYAPYYGPRYWGYGTYGPGGWGYAPYWKGYDPLWGGYPPFGGGYVPDLGPNCVLIGTAIRYTEPSGP
jgi:hypothetical protein